MEKVIKRNDSMLVTLDVSNKEFEATLELVEYDEQVEGRKQKNLKYKLRLEINLPASAGVMGTYGVLSSSDILRISCRSEDDEDDEEELSYHTHNKVPHPADKKAPRSKLLAADGPINVGDWVSFIHTQGVQSHKLVVSTVRYIDPKEPAYLITDHGSVHINKVLEVRREESPF